MPFKNLKDLTWGDCMKEMRVLPPQFAELFTTYLEKLATPLPSNLDVTRRRLKVWRNRWLRVRAILTTMESHYKTRHIDDIAKEHAYLYWGANKGIPQEEIKALNIGNMLEGQ